MREVCVNVFTGVSHSPIRLRKPNTPDDKKVSERERDYNIEEDDEEDVDEMEKMLHKVQKKTVAVRLGASSSRLGTVPLPNATVR